MVSRAYVLDKDGTLVHHGDAIPGARDFLARLIAEDIPHVILSNTGERDGAEVAAALTRTLGFEVAASRIHAARESMAAALREELAKGTIDHVRVVGVPLDGHPLLRPDALPPRDASRECVAVFSDGAVDDYCATVTAVGAWLAHGAQLWITSSDASIAVCRADGGVVHRPGPGAFLNAVRSVAVDARRVRVFGKERDPTMGSKSMDMLRAQGYEGPARGVVMVGDRFDTDVRAGMRHGWSTCLVESGCHTAAHAPLFPADVAGSVAASVRDLAHERAATLGEAVADIVREALRRAPRSQALADWVAARLLAVAQRVDATLQAPPRRIRSVPNLQALDVA